MLSHIPRDTDDALSKVLATVQASNGIGRLLDAFEDVFTVSNRPRSHPFGQRPQCLGISIGVVENKEALHPRPLDEQVPFDAWSHGGRVPGRDGSRAADGGGVV